ncbi:MAG TPA: hypothetical protein VLT61_13765 [Anaeromyxobacteraceae bacterium]|nr:hypothetical protein [Anaeromyxobacteraceae bacterium]
MAKQGIIPVRVSDEDRAALEKAAGDRPVSTWLRDLGLAEARRKAEIRSVGELLDDMARRAEELGMTMTDEEAEKLADEAIHAVRRQRR